MVTQLRVLMILGVLCALQPGRARAQDVGLAAIASPLDGAIVSGIAPVSGTATHPQFQHYELAFAFSPNPTETWFSIQEPATTQVVNDLLGRWDTTGIADGVYDLRLRVFWSERDFIETVVHNVRVQNATPTAPPVSTETPSPSATASRPAPITPTPAVAAITPTALAVSPTPAPGAPSVPGVSLPSDLTGAGVRTAFWQGVRLTLVCFALLGAYVAVKAALRPGK
jgi:hypothetical protein